MWDDGTQCLPQSRMVPGAVGAGPARVRKLRYPKTVERMPGAGQPACDPEQGAWLRAFIDVSQPG
jgi:hypothetical protein